VDISAVKQESPHRTALPGWLCDSLGMSLDHPMILNTTQVQPGLIVCLVWGCAKWVKWNPDILGVGRGRYLNRNPKTY